MTKPYNILPMFRVNKIGKDYIIVYGNKSEGERS